MMPPHSEADRKLATECVKRMRPLGNSLKLEAQIEHVLIYLTEARRQERAAYCARCAAVFKRHFKDWGDEDYRAALAELERDES